MCPLFEKTISVPGFIITLKLEGIKIGLLISTLSDLKVISLFSIFKKVYFFKF